MVASRTGIIWRHSRWRTACIWIAVSSARKSRVARTVSHIDGSNRLSVISQKSLPGLRRQLRRSRHIFRDRGLSHLKAKHQKLAMNPGCAPKWVFSTHPPDQISKATINSWPPCPITRLPTPKHFEPGAMPTQDGLRPNHLHRTKKARPKPRHPYEKSAITAAQSKTR